MKINPIARYWLVLACSCLLVSGFLALLVTGAKAPAIKALITNLDVVRWFLVIHVNLSSLVWFSAVPVALVHMTKTEDAISPREWLGLALAAIGAVLMFSVPPTADLKIILSNYVPMLMDQRYYWALILYAAGVALSFSTLRPLNLLPKTQAPLGVSEIGFGMMMGILLFFMALITTALAFWQLQGDVLGSDLIYFELGMWGGGHLLQHFSSIFLVCCWVLLLSSITNRLFFSRRELFPIFLLLSLSFFAAPLLMYFEVTSNEYRTGFTRLMQFGIAPVVATFVVWWIRRLPKEFWNFRDFRVVAVVMSSFLILMGFTYGSLIVGPDLRVPGHYHASIGAVTLALMATAYHILLGATSPSKWALRSAWTYGIGQSCFASGMFIAGSFGLGRKTYGVEHTFSNLGQTVGFAIMAVGGLVAFTGGLFFAFAVLPQLKGRASSSTPIPLTQTRGPA